MAVIAGTTQVVSEFEIKFDQSLYSISQIDSVRTLMGAEFYRGGRNIVKERYETVCSGLAHVSGKQVEIGVWNLPGK